MIRDLFDINVNDVNKIFSNKVSVDVFEKMDLIYFRIDIDDESNKIKKSPKFDSINKIDQIINSIYKDIVEFAETKIYPKSGEILNVFGPCSIGFFYCPVHKTKCIDYYSIPEKSFIFSDIITQYSHINHDDNITMFDDVCWSKYTYIDNITDIDVNELKRCLLSDDKLGAIKCFVNSTASKLKLEDIEGIIIKVGYKTYQIILNNTITQIDKDTTLMYRDIVLKDFSRVALSDESLLGNALNNNENYLNVVSSLFENYIQKTEILNKYYITEDDLLPPHVGYFGDMSLDSLPETTKKLVEHNGVNKNILRLLLHTFNTSVYNNKFQRFNTYERAKLTEFLVRAQLK